MAKNEIKNNPTNIIDNGREEYEAELKKRRRLMHVGTAVFMVALFLVWIFNMSSFVRANNSSQPAEKSARPDTWQELRNQFNQTMSNVGQKLDAISRQTQTAQQVADANSIKNLANNLEAKYGAASSTATSTALHATSTLVSTSTATGLGGKNSGAATVTSSDEDQIRESLKKLENQLNN